MSHDSHGSPQMDIQDYTCDMTYDTSPERKLVRVPDVPAVQWKGYLDTFSSLYINTVGKEFAYRRTQHFTVNGVNLNTFP